MNIDKKNKRATGAIYEQVAGEYLVSLGYEILEYNYYSRSGEIDIVAKHGDYLVFVEVKYRENVSKGHPLEAISFQKQRSICKCATQYMYQKRIYDVPVRFDVVSILDEEIEVLTNAFEYVR